MSVKLVQICTKASEFNGEFQWQAAGMGYVIQTEANSFIVIDGGFAEDAPHLIRVMKELSGESCPHVVMWNVNGAITDGIISIKRL